MGLRFSPSRNMAKDSKIQSIEGDFFLFGGGRTYMIFSDILIWWFSVRHLRLNLGKGFCVFGNVYRALIGEHLQKKMVFSYGPMVIKLFSSDDFRPLVLGSRKLGSWTGTDGTAQQAHPGRCYKWDEMENLGMFGDCFQEIKGRMPK